MIVVWVRAWVRVRARVGVGVGVAVGVWRGEATERVMTPQATRGVNLRTRTAQGRGGVRR